jgi:hypothetical protein
VSEKCESCGAKVPKGASACWNCFAPMRRAPNPPPAERTAGGWRFDDAVRRRPVRLIPRSERTPASPRPAAPPPAPLRQAGSGGMEQAARPAAVWTPRAARRARRAREPIWPGLRDRWSTWWTARAEWAHGVEAPLDIGAGARRWAIAALRWGSACAVAALVGMAAFFLVSGRGGARATAEEFLNAMRMRDAGTMMRFARVDSALLVRADDLLARLPRVASYHLGEETKLGDVARIPVELVGPAAGRPVAGAGRQRVQITLTLLESRGVWRVDAQRFFRDAFVASLPNGIEEYREIAGEGADNVSDDDSR